MLILALVGLVLLFAITYPRLEARREHQRWQRRMDGIDGRSGDEWRDLRPPPRIEG